MKHGSTPAGIVLCFLILPFCNGCYLIKQGVNLFSYQMQSRPIQRLMRDTALSSKNRFFFNEIERIRAYASDSIGLIRNKNYTRFVTIDRNYLVAVLSAADSASFIPKKWCYPFFGCFPLRGYYDIRDAKRAGERLAGKGNGGVQGGPAGDLYLNINVLPHPIFARDGSDIYIEKSIPFTQAVLGTSIDVPTIDGTIKRIKIPSGTQNGTKIRMKGLGVPALKGTSSIKGDQYVKITVEVPRKINDKQLQLIKKLSDEGL